MRILRVIPSMNPKGGGPCQGIRNAVPEMQKINVSNDVVCFDDINDAFIAKDSFTIYALGKSKSPWSYNNKLIPWLQKNASKYDIIIIHGLWLYHSYATIKFILNYRKSTEKSPKVYVMPHGMLDPYFQQSKERKLKAWRNSIYWKLVENKVINSADGILFTCEEELILARTTFPNYKPKKEINVGYGVQTPPTYKESMKNTFMATVPQWNHKPFILFLSRIHHKKGVDLLIKAYLKLEKELENLPQLIIAGPVDHPYGKEMQNLASSSKNILFTGMLSGEAKWGAFYESEVFALPSHQENFGIAVVEALASSTPVLISNKVNIWREIKEGNAGIISEDNLHDTILMLKNWLSNSIMEKEQMNKNAYSVFDNKFTITKAVLQFTTKLKNA